MAPTGFKSTVSITHSGTATAILSIDGINFLTDPTFDPAGSEYDVGITVLKKTDGNALELQGLPPIDAILLSHEDHQDNLDTLGRTLLNGRHVITTVDGAKNLAPRPGVHGLEPWQSTSLQLGGKLFKITATPCKHLPGGECIGFVIESESFGISDSGLPNVIYVSGDTVYIPELAEHLHEKYHVVLAILNLGAATAPLPEGPLMITMDGLQAIQLSKEIGADIVVPMHFESWTHFKEGKEELCKVFESDESIRSKVTWLVPGEYTQIL